MKSSGIYLHTPLLTLYCGLTSAHVYVTFVVLGTIARVSILVSKQSML